MLNEVPGYKIFQNSQESTCGGVSFLKKLQAEKIRKIHKETAVLDSLSK